MMSAPVMDLPASGWAVDPGCSKLSFAAFTAAPVD
jgi:hypothetical protein